MNYLIRFVIFLLIPFVAACGGGGGGSASSGTTVNAGSPLVGVWEGGGCEFSTEFSQNEFYVFNPDGTVSLHVRSYANTNCSDLVFTAESVATFAEGQEITLDDGLSARVLDFGAVQSRTVTPQSETGAFALNFDAACGITDWENGVRRDVVGCQVGNVEFVLLPPIFQVYRLIDDHFLFFGNEISFTGQSRPRQLSPIPNLLRRQTAAEGFPPEVAGFWRVSGFDVFFEMRANTIVYSYRPSESGADCFDVSPLASRRTVGNTYTDFSGDTVSIVPTASGLNFIAPTEGVTLALVRETSLLASDLVPCQAIAGG